MHRQSSKYRPRYTNAIPWEEIESYYIDLISNHGWQFERVVELIRHIKSSGLSKRLFAYTSVSHLCVSIYDPIEWNSETLRIEFHSEKDGWNFTYHSTPNQLPTFERRYSADNGIEKFDNFIKMIKW